MPLNEGDIPELHPQNRSRLCGVDTADSQFCHVSGVLRDLCNLDLTEVIGEANETVNAPKYEAGQDKLKPVRGMDDSTDSKRYKHEMDVIKYPEKLAPDDANRSQCNDAE